MNKVIAGLKNLLRALSSRNYRLFFIGQSLSLIGTWMQAIALAWLVYRLTNSPFLLGMVGFLSQILTFIFASFAGVLADRWNRHRILIYTQTLSMFQAFVLTYLVYSNRIEIWHIMVLSLTLGLINAFDIPARQAFVIEMVEKKEDIGNAIALNSSMVNGARLIGPSIAGLIIAASGEGFCFFLNGISYIAVIVSLLMMNIKPKQIKKAQTKILHELKEGLVYAYRSTPIKAVLLLLSLMSLVGMPYTVLMPVFVKEILHGGPQTLGFLMAASGIGALIGGVFLASRKNVLGLPKVIAVAAAVLGVGLIALYFSKTLFFSLFLMMLTGFGMMVQIASSNTVLQNIVEDDKRGRIMSLFTMAFMGMAPFGSLLAGSIAHSFGTPNTLMLCGILCLVFAVVYSSRLPRLEKAMHSIHVKMGVIPEVAKGMQTASTLTSPQEEK